MNALDKLAAYIENPLASTVFVVSYKDKKVDGRSKLVSIMGGKWTTYRVMASDTLDVLEKEVLNVPVKPPTSNSQTLMQLQ